MQFFWLSCSAFRLRLVKDHYRQKSAIIDLLESIESTVFPQVTNVWFIIQHFKILISNQTSGDCWARTLGYIGALCSGCALNSNLWQTATLQDRQILFSLLEYSHAHYLYVLLFVFLYCCGWGSNNHKAQNICFLEMSILTEYHEKRQKIGGLSLLFFNRRGGKEKPRRE